MAKMTGLKLRKAIQEGKLVVPISRPEHQKPCWFDDRVRYDPKPWTDGTFRYSAPELEIIYRDPVDFQRWLNNEATHTGRGMKVREAHGVGVA